MRENKDMHAGISRRRASVLGMVALVANAVQAVGQTPNASDSTLQLQEVVVTATKPASTIQETPISITALISQPLTVGIDLNYYY